MVLAQGCRNPMQYEDDEEYVGVAATLLDGLAFTPLEGRSLHEVVTAFWNDGALIQRFHGIAERYGSLRYGSAAAQDIVSDVFADLLGGSFARDTWRSPTLPAQIAKEVRRRGRAVRKRGRGTTSSLDDAPQSVWIDQATEDRHEMVTDPEPLLAAILERAGNDEGVRQLLDIYEERVIDNGELPRRGDALRGGMTQWAYRAARERLDQYAAEARARLVCDVSQSDVLQADVSRSESPDA